MLLAELNHEVFYAPAMLLVAAVLIAVLARWCWPPEPSWKRDEWDQIDALARRDEALRRTEQVQKERTR